MAGGRLDAGEAGYQVGYESQSRFGREYRQVFGTSPGRDAAALKVEALPASPTGARLRPWQVPSRRSKLRSDTPKAIRLWALRAPV